MAIGDNLQLLPQRASNLASDVDRIMLFLTAISTVLVLTLCALVVYFAIRYRRRSEDEVPPEAPHQNWLEIVCALGLLALFMGIFLWGARVYVRMKRPAPYALEVNVIGKQWMWKVQHPGGQREINALHLPLGVPVKLTMTSQDVIHCFGIPAFRIKQDVVPGSYSSQWFTPTKAGEFRLFCESYCGADHSSMAGSVTVMTPSDYEAWLGGVTTDEPPTAAGARLFVSYGCLQCHGQVAPTLAGLYGRRVLLSDGTTVVADDAYIRESIVAPAAKIVAGYAPAMPSYQGRLSEEQLLDLVAYVRSLGAVHADEGSGSPDASAPSSRPAGAVSPFDAARLPPTQQPPKLEPPK
jgi:cytochrome c oxidase subunit 2